MEDQNREQLKLLNRVKRIRGQLNAVERALQMRDNCADILMQLAAVRGGVNGLMGEVLEDHIRLHLAGKADPAGPASETEPAVTPAIAEDLIDLLRAYLK